MNLEYQVCSLELAKKLKEIGVEQESSFYWCLYSKDGWKLNTYEKTVSCFSSSQDDDSYSAYSVAELGELLQWEKLMIFGLPDEFKEFIDGKTSEADVRAKMLIYIIARNLTKGKK